MLGQHCSPKVGHDKGKISSTGPQGWSQVRLRQPWAVPAVAGPARIPEQCWLAKAAGYPSVLSVDASSSVTLATGDRTAKWTQQECGWRPEPSVENKTTTTRASTATAYGTDQAAPCRHAFDAMDSEELEKRLLGASASWTVPSFGPRDGPRGGEKRGGADEAEESETSTPPSSSCQ